MVANCLLKKKAEARDVCRCYVAFAPKSESIKCPAYLCFITACATCTTFLHKNFMSPMFLLLCLIHELPASKKYEGKRLPIKRKALPLQADYYQK